MRKEVILKTFHQVNGIPFTRYELDNNSKKPLIFYFHGFTSNKEDGIMGRGEDLANLGYLVIALDAYAHGERIDESIIGGSASDKYKHLVDIILHTAQDAKSLFTDYLTEHFNIYDDHYDAYGTSMGAATALYLGSICPKLKTIISIVGSPSLYELYLYKKSLYNWEETDALSKKIAYYKTIDPLLHFETLSDKFIFLGCGEHDAVVPPKFAKQLSELLPKDTVQFKLYDLGHTSNEAMLNDALNFLKKHKRA